MDLLKQLEQKQSENLDQLNVDKNIPLEFDLHHLCALDINPLPEIPNALESLSRDGCQLLINAIFTLPIESTEEGVLAKLPANAFKLPRAKPVPTLKLQTRWEKFAAAKGIQKVKKKRVQYSEEHGEYRPTWGYKAQGKTGDLSDWIKEVPVGKETEDQYVAEREEKKARIAKNEMQKTRNLEEAYASKQVVGQRKGELESKIIQTKTSTASLGRFDKKIDNDIAKVKGLKRKFESTAKPVQQEQKEALNLAEKLVKTDDVPEINVRKVVKMGREQKEAENRANADFSKHGKGKYGGSKGKHGDPKRKYGDSKGKYGAPKGKHGGQKGKPSRNGKGK